MNKSREVAFYAGGVALQQIITFGTGVFVARSIGSSDYGVVSLLRNLFTLSLIIAPLGLDLALLRIATPASFNQKLATDIAILRALCAGMNLIATLAAFAIVGPLLERHVYHYPGFSTLLALAMIALPFAADTAIMSSFFKAQGRPKTQVAASLYLQPIVRAVFTVTSISMHWGVAGIILATAIGYISSTIVFNFQYAKMDTSKAGVGTERESKKYAFSRISKILSYSSWLAFTLVAYGALRNIDILALGRSSSAKEIGEYAALSAISQLIPVLAQGISQTIGPEIADLHSQGNPNGARQLLQGYMRSAMLITAPLYAGVAVFSSWLHLVFGKSFYFDIKVALPLATAYLVSGVLAPMGYSLSMTGRHRSELLIVATGTVAVALVIFPFSRQLGASGIASVMCGGYLAINLCRALLASKVIGGFPFSPFDFTPAVACLAIAYACHYAAMLFGPINFATAVLTGCLYALMTGASYFLFVLHSQERQRLVARAGLRKL